MSTIPIFAQHLLIVAVNAIVVTAIAGVAWTATSKRFKRIWDRLGKLEKRR